MSKREIAKIAREIKELKKLAGIESQKAWWDVLLDTYRVGSKVSDEEKAYAKEIAKYISKKVRSLQKNVNPLIIHNFDGYGIDGGNNYKYFAAGITTGNGIGFGFFKDGQLFP